jgi:hypothetical protein
VFTCGEEVAGGHGRRSQAAAAVGAVAPASRRVVPANARAGKLKRCEGKG